MISLNAYIARDLFSAEFIKQPGSIESSFIALAAYIMRHAGDLTWFPLWFGGMPFHNVYQPGMHYTVAMCGAWFHWTPQHAYHLVTAVIYTLAPFTLFCFCRGVTGLPGYSFATALVYSLVSTSALLSSTVWREIGGPFHPRRFATMVMYGEGPHIMATALLPIALLFLYRAAVQRKPIYFPLASAALAAIALTNWPGTIGLAIAVSAFCLSEMGGQRVAWLRMAAIAVVAYLLACRWIPPTTVRLVFGDAQQSDHSYFHGAHFFYLAGLLLVLAAMHVAFERWRVSAFPRFGIYFSFLTGLITLSRYWFGWNVFPQGHRFQIELEMGVAITACYAARLALLRLPVKARWAVIALLFVSGVPMAISNHRYARAMAAPMDMTNTSEYRMARAFGALRPNARVFGPGNVGLWMNLWTDTPQVSGCCDQGIPDYEHRISDYTIYSGQNSGNRDAAYSLTWLRAYGATAVGVTGPSSTDPYRMRNPSKFEGVLPVLWRDGDDAIYDIPERSRSLAHVIPWEATITRAPVHGLDTEQLERYVAALDDAALPEASLVWTSARAARVQTEMRPGQVLSVQISYDGGWNARANGVKRTIGRDKLGQMTIETGCDGACDIRLRYDGGTEARVVAWLQLLGVVLALGAPFLIARLGGL